MVVTPERSLELFSSEFGSEFFGSEDDLDSFPDDVSEDFDVLPVNNEPEATRVNSTTASFDHRSGDTARQYQYSKLAKESQFRLLVLKPKTRGWDDLIRCELRTEDLDNDACRSNFEALSYTWGKSIDLFKIWIEDRFILVTGNLRDALHHLRYDDRDRLLWIDAICINQSAEVEGRSDEQQLNEKTVQVRQMGSIYSKASSVLIWLGLTQLENDQMEDSLLKDDRLFQFLDTRWEGQNYMEYLKLRWKAWPHDKSAVREGLSRMLQHDWFERVWIIQEVALSRSAHILRGEHSVPADVFVQLPQMLGVQPKTHCQQVLNIMPSVRDFGTSQNAACETKRTWKPQKLRTLLQDFRNSKSTKGVDKIYALLGLSVEQECVDGAPKLDYSKTEYQVIRDTIVTLLPELPEDELPNLTVEQFFEYLDILESLLLRYSATLAKTLLQTMDTKPKPLFDDQLLGEAFFYALEHGMSEIVEVVVGIARLDLNCCNDEGNTPSNIAVRFIENHDYHDYDRIHERNDTSTTYDKVVMKLLSIGSIHTDGEKVQDRLTKWCCSRFDVSSLTRGLNLDEALKKLITVGLSRFDASDGRPYLSDAICRRQKDLAKLLISTEGVILDQGDQTGRTPLSYAAGFGDSEVVELLLNTKKVNIDSVDQTGRTPLSHAAQKCDQSTIKLLLQGNVVDVNSQNQTGRKSLGRAARNDVFASTARLLLDLGNADPNIADSQQMTPYDWARQSDCERTSFPLAIGMHFPIARFYWQNVLRPISERMRLLFHV